MRPYLFTKRIKRLAVYKTLTEILVSYFNPLFICYFK